VLEPVVHLLHVPIEVDLGPCSHIQQHWTHAVLFRTLGTRTLRVNIHSCAAAEAASLTSRLVNTDRDAELL
jgi:hypothetical protein